MKTKAEYLARRERALTIARRARHHEHHLRDIMQEALACGSVTTELATAAAHHREQLAAYFAELGFLFDFNWSDNQCNKWNIANRLIYHCHDQSAAMSSVIALEYNE